MKSSRKQDPATGTAKKCLHASGCCELSPASNEINHHLGQSYPTNKCPNTSANCYLPIANCQLLKMISIPSLKLIGSYLKNALALLISNGVRKGLTAGWVKLDASTLVIREASSCMCSATMRAISCGDNTSFPVVDPPQRGSAYLFATRPAPRK